VVGKACSRSAPRGDFDWKSFEFDDWKVISGHPLMVHVCDKVEGTEEVGLSAI
jgi:hypothetical protein